MTKLKLLISIALFSIFGKTNANMEENMIAKIERKTSGVEVELSVPLNHKGETYKTLIVGVYDRNKKLLFNTELTGEFEKDAVVHHFRVSPDLVTGVNLVATYGSGIFCDSITLSAKLSHLIEQK